MKMRAVVVMALAFGTGCVSNSSPRDPIAFDEDDPGAKPAATERVAAPAEPEAPRRNTDIPAEVAGTIPGPSLDAVLDGGPGQFLAGIEVEPAFRSGKFAGWIIMRFEPADERVGAAPLMAGDIVVAVNTKVIAKPQHLQSVWDGLRSATSLVIAGERGGAPFELRYDIGR